MIANIVILIIKLFIFFFFLFVKICMCIYFWQYLYLYVKCSVKFSIRMLIMCCLYCDYFHIHMKSYFEWVYGK